MQPLETRVFKYRGPCTPKNYNMFYNPNICHVCKSTKSNLIPCDKCYLIFYCNDEHKQLHCKEHAEFCKHITLYAIINPPPEGFTTTLVWKNTRENILNKIKRNYNQPLDEYMQEMILLAKSCIICHQQVELGFCRRCFSANYCVRHEEDFRTAHDENECRQLILLFNMNIEYATGLIIDAFSYEFSWLLQDNDFLSMHSFLTQYIRKTKIGKYWIAKDYFQSYYFSEPLTVYYELMSLDSVYFSYQRNFGYQRNYIIHIIATDYVNKYENNLGAWELFIHLSGIAELTIVVIGLNMENIYSYSCSQLCGRCIADGKKLHLIYKSLLYREYILASSICGFSEIFSIPNIVTAFEINLDKDENAENFITIIQQLPCPLLLTCASRRLLEANIEFIERVLHINISSRGDSNNFASLLPRLDRETGRTTAHNKYSFICTSLAGESNTNA